VTKFEKLRYGYSGDTFVKNIIFTIFSNIACIKIKLKAKDNLIKTSQKFPENSRESKFTNW